MLALEEVHLKMMISSRMTHYILATWVSVPNNGSYITLAAFHTKNAQTVWGDTCQILKVWSFDDMAHMLAWHSISINNYFPKKHGWAKGLPPAFLFFKYLQNEWL